MGKKIFKHKSVILIVFRAAEKALLALTAHHCLIHMNVCACSHTRVCLFTCMFVLTVDLTSQVHVSLRGCGASCWSWYTKTWK